MLAKIFLLLVLHKSPMTCSAGSKTFTLFAPTDKAFAGLSTEDLGRTVTDKVLARELVLRHLLPGTLYTNGMRYYQIKDSLLQDRQLTFSKQSGKEIVCFSLAVDDLRYGHEVGNSFEANCV